MELNVRGSERTSDGCMRSGIVIVDRLHVIRAPHGTIPSILGLQSVIVLGTDVVLLPTVGIAACETHMHACTYASTHARIIKQICQQHDNDNKNECQQPRNIYVMYFHNHSYTSLVWAVMFSRCAI